MRRRAALYGSFWRELLLDGDEYRARFIAMNATWCWLILHADLPPSERWVCFRTRAAARAHRSLFGGVLHQLVRSH